MIWLASRSHSTLQLTSPSAVSPRAFKIGSNQLHRSLHVRSTRSFMMVDHRYSHQWVLRALIGEAFSVSLRLVLTAASNITLPLAWLISSPGGLIPFDSPRHAAISTSSREELISVKSQDIVPSMSPALSTCLAVWNCNHAVTWPIQRANLERGRCYKYRSNCRFALPSNVVKKLKHDFKCQFWHKVLPTIMNAYMRVFLHEYHGPRVRVCTPEGKHAPITL